ncbi:SH3 domain-containing protein [Sphingomicrobium sp. XHP0239]|uniref:SH3 domain-containing protein n=1 Tax=Sphingomicrobium maritimum TaxID=3133972 RepID=UPI0031CC6400
MVDWRTAAGRWMLPTAAMAAVMLSTSASAQEDRAVPYWASISSGQAMMRTGPGRNFPGIWLYQRRDLPVKVVQRYDNWRKIEDPDGTTGWMAVALLSDRRTVLVTAEAPIAVRASDSANSPTRYRAEPGVVGRVEECNGNACLVRFGEREGWVSQDDVWGADENEEIN